MRISTDRTRKTGFTDLAKRVYGFGLMTKVLLLVLLSCLPIGMVQVAQAASPVSIILDTDLYADVDDVGALAILHTLQDKGEVKLLAEIIDTPSKWGAPCADAINAYYNHTNIAIGTTKPNDDSTSYLNYAQYLAQNYPHSLQDGNHADAALTVYRRTLAAQPDNSVVIASVGFENELQRLLNSGADSYSSLTGAQLVAQKVRQLVVMGGNFPNGNEFNFQGAPAAAADVANNWPTRIVYDGFLVGYSIATGGTLNQTSANSPIRKAYEIYVGSGNTRSSWDPTAVYYAARGNAGFYDEIGDGSNQVNGSDGSNSWVSSPVKNQVYLQKKVKDDTIASALDTLITTAPLNSASSTPIGQWHLDDESGNTAHDSSVNANSGTLVNSPVWASGKLGGGLRFNGSNNYVTMGNPAALNLGNNDFSLTAWFKTTGANERIISKGHYGWTNGYLLMLGGIAPGGSVVAGVGGGSQSASSLFYTTSAFNDGQWHQVVANFNRSGGTAQIFIDGLAQNLAIVGGTCGNVSGATVSLSACIDMNTTSSDPFVAGSFNGTNEFFNGSLDELQIYNRILSISEIAALSGKPSGLWHFDENAGTTASDASGQGNPGTLFNGPSWTMGKRNNALNFNGSNSYVTMGNPSTLNFGTQSFSLASWFKTTGNTERLISKGHYGWTSGYLLMVGALAPNGRIVAGVGGGSQAGSLLFYTTQAFNDGQWHHAAAVFNRNSNTAQLYVDGTPQSLATVGGTCGSVNGTVVNFVGCDSLTADSGDPFTVGSYNGTAEFFNGSLDEVQVYNYPLDASQVTTFSSP